MTLLTRYLLRNNLFLLFSLLLVGTGLYVLTDLFERIDQFLDASLGLSNILLYYAVKIPFIAGQILPAVFLIAVIVQFCLMAKGRELTALQSGGISPFALLRFVLVYGLLWAVLQFVLGQVFGIEGDKIASRMWREEVKGRTIGEAEMRGLWFTDGEYVVYLGTAYPQSGSGKDFLAYRLSENDTNLEQIVRAETFSVENAVWRLRNATVVTPERYGYEETPEMVIPLTQNLAAFLAIDPATKPIHLPFWALREAIAGLQKSGSNVEVLETALHSRFAYAISIVVMGVLGLAIVLWKDNVYLAVGLGLLVTFIFYACTTLFVSLGERGFLAPLVASWFPIGLFFFLGLAGVFYRVRPRFLGR